MIKGGGQGISPILSKYYPFLKFCTPPPGSAGKRTLCRRDFISPASYNFQACFVQDTRGGKAPLLRGSNQKKGRTPLIAESVPFLMIKYLAASAWLTLYAPYCWPFLFFMTRTVPAIPLRAANITTIHRTAWLDPPVAGVPS